MCSRVAAITSDGIPLHINTINATARARGTVEEQLGTRTGTINT